MEQITNLGIKIKNPSHLVTKYFKNPYLDNLVSYIEARFDDKSVMVSFNVFNSVLSILKALLNIAILMSWLSKMVIASVSDYS